MITKAGLIPYVIEDGQLKMLFMVSSDPQFGGPDPMISKGGVDDGESPYEAAIREAEEELGLIRSNMKRNPYVLMDLELTGLDDTYLMRVFACEMKSKDDFGSHGYETARTVWMTVDEFNRTGRKSHRPIVNRFATVFNGDK